MGDFTMSITSMTLGA
jgi:hypothetical protein